MQKLIIVLLMISPFGCAKKADVPSYLNDYRKEYIENPRVANLAWFKDAGYGLFMHYGLYSQLGKGEWVQFNDTIPVAEYAKFAGSFNPEVFPIDETYSLVRSLSPHALISFKQGANGTEDFMAPERAGSKKVGSHLEIAQKVYELNKDKYKEICNTMQPHIDGIPGATWGYNKAYDGKHRSVEEVLELLADAREAGANLLLNIGPKGDGSFPEEDVEVLVKVGKIIKED